MAPLQQTGIAAAKAETVPENGTITIPVFEEVARVTTRAVTTADVRVHITVSERDETVEALLLRQDVTVERVAFGVQVEAPPPVRHEGDTIVVPVIEERMVVVKRLFLTEELRIRIGETRQPTAQAVRLRREHAEIVRDDLGKPNDNAGELP